MSDDIPPLCPAEHERKSAFNYSREAQRHVVDSFQINVQPRKDDTVVLSVRRCGRKAPPGQANCQAAGTHV